MKNKTKHTRTFSIDDEVFDNFDQLARDNSINISRFVENAFKKYIKEQENLQKILNLEGDKI